MNTSQNAIRIFVTGGTFDKEYNEITGELVFNETHVPEVLQLGRSLLECHVTPVMMIDSLNMTDEHRQTILRHCLEAKEERIVITHGTSTMVQTATLLGEQVKNKTIVFTGAMVPYQFGSSDGLFNLGGAVAFVQALSYGTYITMNGRCFVWNNVRKNVERGIFEPINPLEA